MIRHPLILLFALPLASTAIADDCAHRAERNLDLDASAIATLELRTGAGDLDVVGEPGLDRVVVRGVACASEAGWLDGIRLVHRSSGDRLELATEIPDTQDGSWFGSSYRRLDLSIRVPARLVLDAKDSSGDVEVEGVAGLTIQDSSGDLEIDHIAGDVRITDTSGDIEVSNVDGRVHVVSDSSGDIEIEDIAGDVTIDGDSSGDIELQRIRGNAHVARDSSGDIHFEDVQGSASVGTDSSGSIKAIRIGRDFTVDADSGGGIDYREVGGRVSLPRE